MQLSTQKDSGTFDLVFRIYSIEATNHCLYLPIWFHLVTEKLGNRTFIRVINADNRKKATIIKTQIAIHMAKPHFISIPGNTGNKVIGQRIVFS